MPSGDKQALVCLIEDFAPSKVSVKWKKGETMMSTSYFVPEKTENTYSTVSILKVDKTSWDNKDVYTCETTHQGKTQIKKVSKGTITLL